MDQKENTSHDPCDLAAVFASCSWQIHVCFMSRFQLMVVKSANPNLMTITDWWLTAILTNSSYRSSRISAEMAVDVWLIKIHTATLLATPCARGLSKDHGWSSQRFSSGKRSPQKNTSTNQRAEGVPWLLKTFSETLRSIFLPLEFAVNYGEPISSTLHHGDTLGSSSSWAVAWTWVMMPLCQPSPVHKVGW